MSLNSARDLFSHRLDFGDQIDLGARAYYNLPSLGVDALSTDRASAALRSVLLVLPREDHSVFFAPKEFPPRPDRGRIDGRSPSRRRSEVRPPRYGSFSVKTHPAERPN